MMKQKRRLVSAVAIASAFFLFGSTAMADRTIVKDGKSDLGDPGAGVDMRSASHGHSKTGKLKHKIVSWGKMDETPHPVRLYMRTATARFATEGRYMFNYKNKRTGRVTESRPDDHTIIYKFWPRAIGNPDWYRWKVRSAYACETCDRVPNRGHGRVLHTLK